jgi:hypothetical protein
MHVLQMRNRSQIAQETDCRFGIGSRRQMLSSGQYRLPLCVQGNRQRNLKLAAGQHGQQVKACAITGTRSGHKHRSIKNYTQSGYASKLVTPVQLYFTLSIGQSNRNQIFRKCLLFKHHGQNYCFFTGPSPEHGFSAELTVSKCQLRGQNDQFDKVNLNVLPLLYAEKLIKLVKYSYRFTTSRNSGFHCVSESPMVI